MPAVRAASPVATASPARDARSALGRIARPKARASLDAHPAGDRRRMPHLRSRMKSREAFRPPR
jgi:hypothetical protein